MAGTRAVIAVAALLAGPMLSGCSGDDPVPKVEPSSPVSSSMTASPSNASSSPTADDERVVRQFFSAVSTSLSTGDPKPFLRLATDNCVNCRALAFTLREQYADGGRIEGGNWVVSSARFVRTAPLGRIWDVDVMSDQERWFNKHGQLEKIVRKGMQRFGVAVSKTRGSWLVRELKLRSR